MNIQELVENWLRYFNRNYPRYLNSYNEPRYQAKIFLFYSYQLFSRLNEIRYWDDYIQSLENIFLRDPSNDYYGHRNPQNSTRNQPIALEWVITFEIIKSIGFPGNQSAQEKLVKYVKQYFYEIEQNLEMEKFHDLMICSSIGVPKLPNNISWISKWLLKNYDSEKVSPHNLVAYLNFFHEINDMNTLGKEMVDVLINWIKNNSESPRRQILALARIITKLEWVSELYRKDILDIQKKKFFACLANIKQIDWVNSPLILEAAYFFSTEQEKREIQHILLENLTSAKFYKLKDIFPFLKENVKLDNFEKEVLSIKEKCIQNPTKVMCENCLKEPQGECWTRILAKILGVTPSTHFSFEIGDIVKYTHQKGIYFVIKSGKIDRQRGEGDVLFRQCVSLFNTDYALVFYLNPHYTAPMVIEPIRRTCTNMQTNPIFFVIERNYIFQIYAYYKEINPEIDATIT
ncbi:MAG: hypothetical protein ACFFB5_23915 [Promethearchaeota archaeon]